MRSNSRGKIEDPLQDYNIIDKTQEAGHERLATTTTLENIVFPTRSLRENNLEYEDGAEIERKSKKVHVLGIRNRRANFKKICPCFGRKKESNKINNLEGNRFLDLNKSEKREAIKDLWQEPFRK